MFSLKKSASSVVLNAVSFVSGMKNFHVMNGRNPSLTWNLSPPTSTTNGLSCFDQ
jgi:hypothetical protein